MGLEHRVKASGNITEMFMKSGGGLGVGHRWEVRKSTVVGPTAPALNTYTTVVATGIHNIGAVNVWEAVGIGAPIAVSPNEWVLSYHFVGVGGQTSDVTTLRGSGQLVEDYAELMGSLYRNTPGGTPGPSPLLIPSNRSTGTVYGINTLSFGA